MTALAAAVDGWLRARLAEKGRAGLPDGADLHDEGLLDSLSLVDLLRAVESATGREVDLLDLDLDALTTVAAVKAELARVLTLGDA